MGEREMLADDIGIGPRDLLARSIVEAIFRDIRGRKFLSYLFEAGDPENVGSWGRIDHPIDIEAQRDIAESWTRIVRSRLP
jgi:hypothetical protein